MIAVGTFTELVFILAGLVSSIMVLPTLWKWMKEDR